MKCPSHFEKTTRELLKKTVVKRKYNQFRLPSDDDTPPRLIVANGIIYAIDSADRVYDLGPHEGEFYPLLVYDNIENDTTPIRDSAVILTGYQPDVFAVGHNNTVRHISQGEDVYPEDGRPQLSFDNDDTPSEVFVVQSGATPDEQKVLFATNDGIFIYDLNEYEVKGIKIPSEDGQYVNGMAVIDNNRAVVTYSHRNTNRPFIKVVDLESGEFKDLPTGDNKLKNVTDGVTQNDKFVVVGGVSERDTNMLLLYDKETLSLVSTIETPNEYLSLNSIQITPNGKYIVFSDFGGVHYVDIKTQKFTSYNNISDSEVVVDNQRIYAVDEQGNVIIIEIDD